MSNLPVDRRHELGLLCRSQPKLERELSPQGPRRAPIVQLYCTRVDRTRVHLNRRARSGSAMS